MTTVVYYGKYFHGLLYQPKKVFLLSLFFVCSSLIFSGNLLRLYGLYRDHNRIREQIGQVSTQIIELNKQLRIVQDPIYIERQAMDRYDLVEENDLVFVFADE